MTRREGPLSSDAAAKVEHGGRRRKAAAPGRAGRGCGVGGALTTSRNLPGAQTPGGVQGGPKGPAGRGAVRAGPGAAFRGGEGTAQEPRNRDRGNGAASLPQRCRQPQSTICVRDPNARAAAKTEVRGRREPATLPTPGQGRRRAGGRLLLLGPEASATSAAWPQARTGARLHRRRTKAPPVCPHCHVRAPWRKPAAPLSQRIGRRSQFGPQTGSLQLAHRGLPLPPRGAPAPAPVPACHSQLGERSRASFGWFISTPHPGARVELTPPTLWDSSVVRRAAIPQCGHKMAPERSLCPKPRAPDPPCACGCGCGSAPWSK